MWCSVGSILLQAWVTHIAKEGATGSPARAVGLLAVSATTPVPVSHCPPLVFQELSARGVHPPARGWSSVGMGTIIHTWSCCVSGP